MKLVKNRWLWNNFKKILFFEKKEIIQKKSTFVTIIYINSWNHKLDQRIRSEIVEKPSSLKILQNLNHIDRIFIFFWNGRWRKILKVLLKIEFFRRKKNKETCVSLRFVLPRLIPEFEKDFSKIEYIRKMWENCFLRK